MIWIVAGAAIVFLILFDIFQSVIVPRPVPRRLRLSALLSRTLWRIWRFFAMRQGDPDRRENILSTYAPFWLVLLLAIWTASLVVGYGLMFYGLSAMLSPSPGVGGALYFAGTTLITIGFGDIVPKGPAARILAVAAGATGFAVVAVVTSFLFSLFAAFQAREVFVLRLAAIAGMPASGIEILETASELGVRDNLADLFMRGQNWASTVLETHLAYPVLAFFRSNHDNLSWIAALGALLDASTLLISTVADEGQGEAHLMNRVGQHLVSDLATYFGLPLDESPGIERGEFDAARDRLASAGFSLIEPERAWLHFCELRGAYSTPLNTLAQYWRIPPAQWIGDRSRPRLTAHAR